MADLRLPFREALIQYLRANAALTALVPSDSIYGERVPAKAKKPYIALSRMPNEDFQASCIDGARVAVRLNVIADSVDSGTVIQISSTLVDELNDAQLSMDRGWCFDLSYVRTNSIMPRGETTEWHDVVTFSALMGVGD